VANEYQSRGYEVVLQPNSDQLPAFLQNFHPDLIARKGGEAVVIEVKSRQAFAQMPWIREMARLLQGQEGWNFELILVEDFEKFNIEAERSLNQEEILNTLTQAQRLLDTGLGEASMLVAWSAVEAGLRLLAQSEELELEQATPVRLIKMLLQEGIISRHEYDLFQDAIRVRNAFAHGYKIDADIPFLVQQLIETLADLLDLTTTDLSEDAI
jgi:uncharacterized protein YutE (UPF0331/DUF86 family)